MNTATKDLENDHIYILRLICNLHLLAFNFRKKNNMRKTHCC